MFSTLQIVSLRHKRNDIYFCFYINQPQFTFMQIFIKLLFTAKSIFTIDLRDAIINIAACLTSEYKPLTVRSNVVSKITIFID